MKVADFVQALEQTRWHVGLWHAAQLKDFETYVQLGHIASRAELFQHGSYTPFDSDGFDVEQNIDRHIFGNLVDQGIMSKNGRGVPNVYGPITFRFKPRSLIAAGVTDVVVRRAAWSALAANREPIESPEQLIEICDSNGTQPEVQLVGGTLDISLAQRIIVNDVRYRAYQLIDEVADDRLCTAEGAPIPINRRDMSEEGLRIYRRLVEWAIDLRRHNADLEALPNDLRKWFDRLNGSGKLTNVPRFPRYLYEGTISVMQDRWNWDMHDENDYEKNEYETAEDDFDGYEYDDDRDNEDVGVAAWYVDGVSIDDLSEERDHEHEPISHDRYSWDE